MAQAMATESIASPFWARVDKSGDCWLWLGSINAAGYGVLSINGRTTLAHRFAYTEAVGRKPLPTSPLVLHRCDNPRCVNPAHLREGTHRDNGEDYRRRVVAGGAPGARASDAEVSVKRPVPKCRKGADLARGASALRTRLRRKADEVARGDARHEERMARICASLAPFSLETLCRSVMGQAPAPLPVEDVVAYLTRKATDLTGCPDPFEQLVRKMCVLAVNRFEEGAV